MTITASPATKPSRPSVVERMTSIMDVFTLGEGPLLLEDISGYTGLPRSTAFRILTQLTDLSWLDHGPRGYTLGARAQGLAAQTPMRSHDDLREAAAHSLNQLHAATGAVAHLGVLEGPRIRYLDKIGGAATTTVPSRVGGRLPADHTVCGKALLAGLAPEDVDAILDTYSGQRRTPLDLPVLHHQLTQIRRHHGVAIDSADRCSMGITAVAAPIRNRHGVVGAISVAGRGSLPTDRIVPMVLHAARATADALN